MHNPTTLQPSKKLLPLAALSMSFLLTGCATTQIADSSCKVFRPIHWSQKDTTQTKREVVTHNKKYDAICK